jgi:hypothetical protein
VQPTDIAIALRRRTPWEAMDLGLAMLQRWWRQVYLPHFVVGIAAALAGWGLSLWAGKAIVALLFVWWLKPLYDRVVLHVLSRAVFGEAQSTRHVLGAPGEWLRTGLFWALTLGRFDTARAFNLPVRQLEGQRSRAARERRNVLGRRVGSYATWLHLVCFGFEVVVLYWGLSHFTSLLLPAKAAEGQDFTQAFLAGNVFGYDDVLAYTAAVLLLEPFYVAAGFALYLNRRTLLEGWDIEVALRKITQRHAVAAMLVVCCMLPLVCFSSEKNPKQEIAEVLKAPEFPHQIEAMRWQRRNPLDDSEPARQRSGDGGWLRELGIMLAGIMRVLFWVAAGGVLAYAIWWAMRMLPRVRSPLAEAYRPPASLFGMDIAPEKLPADIGAAAAALARAGRLREALGLLYRGALSDLVHRRGVELLASHTELEALQLATKRLDSDRSAYLQTLVRTWRECAYSRRAPGQPEVEHLAAGYTVMAAP